MSQNAMLLERKACCHVANAFLSRLELIWPISSLKISKMSKKCVFDKKLSESKGLKYMHYHVSCTRIFVCKFRDTGFEGSCHCETYLIQSIN